MKILNKSEMPKTKESKTISLFEELNIFYWELNLNTRKFTFNEKIKLAFKDLDTSISIDSFLSLFSETSAKSFENLISQYKEDNLNTFQIFLTLAQETDTPNIFFNGKADENNPYIIHGIGQPTKLPIENHKTKKNLESTILEKAPVMICLTDIEGNITYVNPEFSKVTEYQPKEILNQSSRIFKSGHHSDEFYKNLWDTILEEKTWEGQFLNRKKNGAIYWEKSIIAPYYDEKSNLKGFIKASEDLSQEKKTKKQLEAERNLFFEGPVVVFKWDTNINGGITYTSPNVKEVLGYTSEEFINKINYIEIIHPDDRDFIVEETKKYIDKNESVSYIQDYRLKTKDGNYKYFIDHTSIIRDENNQIINFSGYLIDNTEYIEAQKELKKSESKYRDVFNTAGVGIVYTTKEGIIVDANLKFEELVFAEPGELIGQSAMELINKRLPGKSTLELLPVLFHILKGNRIDPKVIHIENKYYEIQSDYNPVLQTNIGILRDITEQKIATQKVRESEQKYKYLVDNMNDGIVITDENEKLTFMNKAAIKIFEGDIDSFESQTIKEVATETSVDIINQQESLRKKGETTTYYIEIVTKNNIKKNLEITASPLFNNDNYTGSFGILRDITEEIRAEMELKSAYSQMKLINRKLQDHAKELEIAKEKAEESDRLKTAFLANISHEIRTPMNGIVGFAQLTMNPGITEEKRNNYLQIITESTMQLESVVMDIIDLSKIESGEAKFNKKEIDIEEVIIEAFEANKKAAEDKNLEYSLENFDSLSPLITVRQKFKQVLNILIGNAIKFTPEGEVKIVCQQQNSFIYIKIIDTGIGIAAEHQEIIFEPFRQVEIAMRRRFGGTGLGLTIAKKIAQTLGGDILIESELDKGSIFTFAHPI